MPSLRSQSADNNVFDYYDSIEASYSFTASQCRNESDSSDDISTDSIFDDEPTFGASQHTFASPSSLDSLNSLIGKSPPVNESALTVFRQENQSELLVGSSRISFTPNEFKDILMLYALDLSSGSDDEVMLELKGNLSKAGYICPKVASLPLQILRETASVASRLLISNSRPPPRQLTSTLTSAPAPASAPPAAAPETWLQPMLSGRLNVLPARYLSEYEDLGALGSGGFGTVRRGRSRVDGRISAVKLQPVLGAAAGGRSTLSDTAREVRVHAALSSLGPESIVEYRGAWVEPPWLLGSLDNERADEADDYHLGWFCISMEICTQTLTSLPRPFSVRQAATYTTHILQGLDSIHRAGVVHRDIKPDNILIRDGRPVIADFGLAALVGDTEGVAGTALFAAPELETAVAAPAADIYSTALVLLDMLVGPLSHWQLVAARKGDFELPEAAQAFEGVLRQMLGPSEQRPRADEAARMVASLVDL